MNKIIGLIVLVSMISASCNDYKEIKKEDLSSAFILNSSKTFKGYYYIGSDNVYHYFESRWNFTKDKKFKIPANQFRVEEKYKFKLDEKELRIDVFSIDKNELFAQNEFYKLYVVHL